MIDRIIIFLPKGQRVSGYSLGFDVGFELELRYGMVCRALPVTEVLLHSEPRGTLTSD